MSKKYIAGIDEGTTRVKVLIADRELQLVGLGSAEIPTLHQWLLENDPAIKEAVKKGEACFGTVNSWLLWKFTGGKIHCSDMANMSVTLLQNAVTRTYDADTLEQLQIPREIMPEITGTGEVFGTTCEDVFSGAKIPIAAMLGDQMAAALGQCCIVPGMVKTTYGTGSFSVLIRARNTCRHPRNRHGSGGIVYPET